MKNIKFLLSILATILILYPSLAIAGPASTNYELEEYGFGAGGTDTTMNSTNYKMFGTAGEVEYGRPSSTNYKAGSGLVFTLKLNVPPAPTLSNPATNYDRLKFVINEGGNASDATYAIAISTDNFASDTRYVKSDATIGTSLTTSDFKTYADWGGSDGTYVTGLQSGTTYYIKARARIGNFTETEWGPATEGIATSNSSLTFSLDSSEITFSDLNSGNSYTDSSKATVMTTSTNAYNGYGVYAKETQSLTSANSDTISNYEGTNATPTSWSGTGFGYTTDDANLGGAGGTNRFATGTKYAGFSTDTAYVVADHSGPVQNPVISNEEFNISYRITVDATTPAGTYTNVILYTIVPSF